MLLMVKVMDEVFLNNVSADNIKCMIHKTESAILGTELGILPNDNFFCDLSFHSIIESALNKRKMLSECDLTKIVNVYYRITGI